MAPYDQIETFGLIGPDYLNEIPVGNPDLDPEQAIEQTFTALADAFADTLIGALDSEPLLWAFVNLFHRHAQKLEKARDAIGQSIKSLPAILTAPKSATWNCRTRSGTMSAPMSA